MGWFSNDNDDDNSESKHQSTSLMTTRVCKTDPADDNFQICTVTKEEIKRVNGKQQRESSTTQERIPNSFKPNNMSQLDQEQLNALQSEMKTLVSELHNDNFFGGIPPLFRLFGMFNDPAFMQPKMVPVNPPKTQTVNAPQPPPQAQSQKKNNDIFDL